MKINRESGGFVTEEPLCATLEGELCACNTPEANTLVAAAGALIPPKLAKLYGLKSAGEEDPPRPTQLPAAQPEAEEEKPTRRSLK